MGNKILIELYSDMPSNSIVDYKSAGDFIKVTSKDAIKLIDILLEENVEFVVWEIGECLIDKSYKYWEKNEIIDSI